MVEYMNCDMKGQAGPFRSGYSTDMKTVNNCTKTAHIHATLRSMLKKKMDILTSSTHRELTQRKQEKTC